MVCALDMLGRSFISFCPGAIPRIVRRCDAHVLAPRIAAQYFINMSCSLMRCFLVGLALLKRLSHDDSKQMQGRRPATCEAVRPGAKSFAKAEKECPDLLFVQRHLPSMAGCSLGKKSVQGT